MVVKQEIRKVLAVNAKTAYKNLLAGIKKENWDVIYKEPEDFEVFGMTTMFGGWTLLSAYAEGARYVPFFARIFPQGKKCQVLVIAGGSENWLGWDFGRNKKVVEKILKMCSGKQ